MKSIPSVQSHLNSKFRGCILGAIVGDCIGARFDSHAEPFAAIASKTEPASLRNQIPRSGGKFLFPFGVDSLMLLATSGLLLDSLKSKQGWSNGFTKETLRDTLQSSLRAQAGESSSIKWSIGTRHVLENESMEASLRSNCGVTRALVAGLWDPELAGPICSATHTHSGAIKGAKAFAEAVHVAMRQDRLIEAHDIVDKEYQSVLEKAVNLAATSEYDEDDEFSTRLQDMFAARFGADASARCGVAGALFAVRRTILALPYLDATSAAYRERIMRVSKPGSVRSEKGLSLNALGNSNRLDSAALFSRLTPSIEQDLPVAIAVNWAISLGGDCRSNAYLAGGLAGALWGEAAIPEEWLLFSEGVERGGRVADQFSQLLGSALRK